ncbi:hypothetical protein OKA05_27015 [Luteolibacter arcticus]|uniref:Uncharacterized protein n=1 Tax=Luteolibacter arcticus TaxID=1581411 RepID=A0ABT3GRZ8_9BACT|nr:hypothetical protein [Luteolibacter arcticus]MCW1926238.1 hypothetical protein [Luteolibacter arcticus]
MSSPHDTAWQSAIDTIASSLAADLPFVRSLEPVHVHVREHTSESLTFTYGIVRYPRESPDSDHESFVVFADRKTFGPFLRRYLAGFQFTEDDDAVHPLLDATLAELGD